MQKKPYELLFQEDSPEESLWHGLPMSLNAFGGFHWVDQGTISQTGYVETGGDEYEMRYYPEKHWPSLTHGTVYIVNYDIINVWLESDGIGRDSFRRISRRWYPSHLVLGWKAENIRIFLKVAVIDRDSACIHISVRNEGNVPFSGKLIVKGDINRCNFNHTNQSWSRCTGKSIFSGNNSVVVDKKVDWGMRRRFYPFHRSLKPEDSDFRWERLFYSFAFSLSRNGWQKRMVPADKNYETWQFSKNVNIAPSKEYAFQAGFAGHWSGRKKTPVTKHIPLINKATEAAMSDFDRTADRNRILWSCLFQRVPVLKKGRSSGLLRLYYKAWTSIYYNTIPAVDMILYKSKFSMGTCCKVAPSTMAMCPATWECALIALCLALVKPELACEIIKGIYQTMEEDGYIGELPGDRRGTSLPIVEPFVIWVCYRKTGDKEFLKKLFPAIKKNLLYKLRNPSWEVHGTHMCRNYAYAHIGTHYTLKIARALRRPGEEIALLQEMLEDSRAAINSFWNENGGFYNLNAIPALTGLGGVVFEEATDAEALIPLYLGCKPEYARRLLDILRDEFLTEDGVIRKRPKTLPGGLSGTWHNTQGQQTFTLKESNLMFLPFAVKKYDRKLFEKISHGTIENIRKAGDFYECYDYRGRGRHNGPGSIFGAFAVIWLMLLEEDLVDELYK